MLLPTIMPTLNSFHSCALLRIHKPNKHYESGLLSQLTMGFFAGRPVGCEHLLCLQSCWHYYRVPWQIIRLGRSGTGSCRKAGSGKTLSTQVSAHSYSFIIQSITVYRMFLNTLASLSCMPFSLCTRYLHVCHTSGWCIHLRCPVPISSRCAVGTSGSFIAYLLKLNHVHPH